MATQSRCLTLILIVAAGCLLLATSSANAWPGQVAPPVVERVPVRWFVGLGEGWQPAQLAGQQQVVADFNAAQTGISLTLEVVDNSTAAQVLQDEIRSGNAPDIIGPVGIAGSNPYELLDLTSLITATGYNLGAFDAPVIDAHRDLHGKLTGLPLMIFPSFIYYNPDLFDAAGLAYPPHAYGQPYTDTLHGGPWTVDKLAEIAKLMTLDNTGKNSTEAAFDAANIVQYGFVPQWSDEPRNEASLFGAGSFADANGDAQIPPNWRTAFKWYYAARWGSQPFAPDQTALDGSLLEGNAFSSGKVAMANSYLWYLCCLNTSAVPGWDIAATPAYSGTVTARLHADGFRILAASQHPAEAFEALQYLVGPAAPTLFSLYGSGRLPARTSLQSAAVAQLELEYPGVDWQVMLDSIAYAQSPNPEVALPNDARADVRINTFGSLVRGQPFLNMDSVLAQLQTDLQWIFHERLLYLPIVKR